MSLFPGKIKKKKQRKRLKLWFFANMIKTSRFAVLPVKKSLGWGSSFYVNIFKSFSAKNLTKSTWENELTNCTGKSNFYDAFRQW